MTKSSSRTGRSIFLKFDGWHFTEVRGYRARDMELISGKPDIVGFDYGTSDPDNVSGVKAEHRLPRGHMPLAVKIK